MVLKRTFKLFTAVALKRTDWRLGRCSTVAAVWRRLTVPVAGMVAADDLAVRWWLLEEAAGGCVSAGESRCGVSICW